MRIDSIKKHLALMRRHSAPLPTRWETGDPSLVVYRAGTRAGRTAGAILGLGIGLAILAGALWITVAAIREFPGWLFLFAFFAYLLAFGVCLTGMQAWFGRHEVLLDLISKSWSVRTGWFGRRRRTGSFDAAKQIVVTAIDWLARDRVTEKYACRIDTVDGHAFELGSTFSYEQAREFSSELTSHLGAPLVLRLGQEETVVAPEVATAPLVEQLGSETNDEWPPLRRPPGERIQWEHYDDVDRLQIARKRHGDSFRQRLPMVFLAIGAMWVMGAATILSDPDGWLYPGWVMLTLVTALVLVFLALTVWALLEYYTGHDIVEVRAGEIQVVFPSRVPFLTWREAFPSREIRDIQWTRSKGILILGCDQKKNVQFGEQLNGAEKEWVVALLKRRLAVK